MKNARRIQMEETKEHGDVLFPFNIYPCTIPKDFPSVALHWHRNMEIIYIKKGTLLCRLGVRNEAVSRGDICVARHGWTDGGIRKHHIRSRNAGFWRSGCSSGHFMRWFKQMTGSSFISCMNEYRLARAAQQRGEDFDHRLGCGL